MQKYLPLPEIEPRTRTNKPQVLKPGEYAVKTAHTRIITAVPVVTSNTINYLIDRSVSRFEVDG